MLGALVLGWSIKGEDLLSFLCVLGPLSKSYEARWVGVWRMRYKGAATDSTFRPDEAEETTLGLSDTLDSDFSILTLLIIRNTTFFISSSHRRFRET